MSKQASRVYLAGGITAGKKAPDKPAVKVTLSLVLQQVAKKMLPFYRTIAQNGRYAGKWSDAVVKLELDRMEKLLKAASPHIGSTSLGTNGIGYFVSFSLSKPIEQYANGTMIPPGIVQAVFEPKAHRAVAAAVYPLYRTIAYNHSFAKSLADAIEQDDPEAVARLVRSKIKTGTLKSIAIEVMGIALTFRFPFTKYPYRSLLFRDVPEDEKV